jgi:hypothetical protein
VARLGQDLGHPRPHRPGTDHDVQLIRHADSSIVDTNGEHRSHFEDGSDRRICQEHRSRFLPPLAMGGRLLP